MIKKYEYLPEHLLIPAQAWGLAVFLYNKLGVFIVKDLNRITWANKERRFASKLDPPAFSIEFNGIEASQEDYAVYNYLPIGAFIGKKIPDIIEADGVKDVVIEIFGEEIRLNLKGIKWDTFPVLENYPVPNIASNTNFEGTGRIAATFQRVTANWTIRYLGKVFDIFPDSLPFSVSSLITTFKKYFPINVFVPIGVKQFPLPDGSTVELGAGGLFLATLTDHRLSEVFVEENRRLEVEFSLSTRQTVIGAFVSSEAVYFPVFVNKFKEGGKGGGSFNLFKEDP